MELKVGDTVKIREWDDMEEEFGLTKKGNINTKWVFTKGMRYLCGSMYTIETIDHKKDLYSLTSNDARIEWQFDEGMFEPARSTLKSSKLF